jgi:cystathionine beta-lyase
MSANDAPKPHHPDTVVVHAGYDPHDFHGFVNPPVVHASTVLFETAAAHLSGAQRYTYGRQGTPTTDAFEAAVTALEGAAGTRLAPSGLAAVSLAILAATSAGDHLLVTDSVYAPTRRFCESTLKRFGIETTYFDPAIGADIAGLVRPNTRAVFLEAPGTATFEMQDVPAIAAIARERGLTVLMDNTWATPLYFKPLAHGVDLSIQAATKYISGHSDVLIGTVAAGPRLWKALAETHRDLGLHVGPDDVYLAWRGLKTMAVRLARHQASGLAVARWLSERPEVARVLHPGLPEDPGHALWRRDFSGASGLFSIELRPVPEAAVTAFLDALTLFGMGYSWGGFESLVVKPKLDGVRTVRPWTGGPLLRLHVGLEDVADLTADLERGFAAMAAAAAA